MMCGLNLAEQGRAREPQGAPNVCHQEDSCWRRERRRLRKHGFHLSKILRVSQPHSGVISPSLTTARRRSALRRTPR